MNLLLLSGNSKRGKEWLQQVDANLAPQFDRTYRHNYAHWENDEPEIDLDYETERLITSAQDLSPYMVFAKSAGTVLASKAADTACLRPKACLFVGLPLVMIRNQNLPVADWLQTAHFPIDILQHTNDPLGSHADVMEYIQAMGIDNVIVHELPGDTHDYLEFQTFKEFTKRLKPA